MTYYPDRPRPNFHNRDVRAVLHSCNVLPAPVPCTWCCSRLFPAKSNVCNFWIVCASLKQRTTSLQCSALTQQGSRRKGWWAMWANAMQCRRKGWAMWTSALLLLPAFAAILLLWAGNLIHLIYLQQNEQNIVFERETFWTVYLWGIIPPYLCFLESLGTARDYFVASSAFRVWSLVDDRAARSNIWSPLSGRILTGQRFSERVFNPPVPMVSGLTMPSIPNIAFGHPRSPLDRRNHNGTGWF